MKTPSTIRLGAVAYLNTKPLIYGLESRLAETGSLRLELPSRLASELAEETLDVGLIPVVEYLRHLDSYRVVSDAVIACKGPVWSVRILFRKPPEKVETLAIDEGSRSSVALATLLLGARFGRIPTMIPFPIGVSPEAIPADAVLVIGDRAMRPERYRQTFMSDWDLGQEWYVETGLPFVFAMWVARAPCYATEGLSQLLESCRDEGCSQIEEIVRSHAEPYGLSNEQCREYLSRFLRFRFGKEEQAGLREYHRRCVAFGLVPASDLP
jgi:chorismate dehydratase